MTSFHCRETDKSDSVVFSFQKKWLEPLSQDAVCVFFRRKIPTKVISTSVYIYVGAPISSMLGHAAVKSIMQVNRRRRCGTQLLERSTKSSFEATSEIDGRLE